MGNGNRSQISKCAARAMLTSTKQLETEPNELSQSSGETPITFASAVPFPFSRLLSSTLLMSTSTQSRPFPYRASRLNLSDPTGKDAGSAQTARQSQKMHCWSTFASEIVAHFRRHRNNKTTNKPLDPEEQAYFPTCSLIRSTAAPTWQGPPQTCPRHDYPDRTARAFH